MSLFGKMDVRRHAGEALEPAALVKRFVEENALVFGLGEGSGDFCHEIVGKPDFDGTVVVNYSRCLGGIRLADAGATFLIDADRAIKAVEADHPRVSGEQRAAMDQYLSDPQSLDRREATERMRELAAKDLGLSLECVWSPQRDGSIYAEVIDAAPYIVWYGFALVERGCVTSVRGRGYILDARTGAVLEAGDYDPAVH